MCVRVCVCGKFIYALSFLHFFGMCTRWRIGTPGSDKKHDLTISLPLISPTPTPLGAGFSPFASLSVHSIVRRFLSLVLVTAVKCAPCEQVVTLENIASSYCMADVGESHRYCTPCVGTICPIILIHTYILVNKDALGLGL